MITRIKVEAAINYAEVQYLKCWRILASLKGGDSKRILIQGLPRFQSTLAESIFSLSEMYHVISRERNDLIRKKSTLSQKWFENRVRLIQKYQDSLNQAIAVGKNLGDAFAWLFYHKESELLREHSKHERNFHIPSGIGGRGEIEFLKKVTSFEGWLVIYHGTTTFLRVGDVSLVNLNTWSVTAIGELKSKRLGDKGLEVQLVTIGPTEKFGPLNKDFSQTRTTRGKESLYRELAPEIRRTLDRQIKSIVKSFDLARKEVDVRLSHGTNVFIREFSELLESASSNAVSYQRLGDGLVLVAVQDNRRSLASRLMLQQETNWAHRLNGIVEPARQTVDPKSKENSLAIYETHNPDPKYQIQSGMTPLFWWPLDSEFIKRIVFHEVLLFGIYNPAHFLRKLRSAGFQVKQRERGQYQIWKQVGSRTISMEHFQYFINLIVLQLFSEETVIDLINSIVSRIEADDISGNARIEMQFIQDMLI